VRRVCTVPFVSRADPPGTRGISFVKDNVAAALALMVLMALMCCGIPVARVAVVTGILAVVRRIGFPVSLGLAVVIAVIVLMVRQVRASRQRRMLDRWGASARWSPVPDRTAWPWTAGMPRPGKVDVRLAYKGFAGPFPMVVGEITWTGGALEFDADRLDGRGVFWVIRPSEPWPVAAVQRRHNKSSPRAEPDDFLRLFRCVVADQSVAGRLEALADPAVRAAHIDGTVPAWTSTGDEVYAVITTRRRLSPALIAELTAQAPALARLLDLPC
jgi:hypothetical protein